MLEYFAAYVLPSRPHIPLIHILRINDEIKLVAIEGHLGSLNKTISRKSIKERHL